MNSDFAMGQSDYTYQVKSGFSLILYRLKTGFLFLMISLLYVSCVQWPVASALLETQEKNSNENSLIVGLLATGNPSSPTPGIPTSTPTANCSTTGGCYIYYSSPTSGAMGGITGADAICQASYSVFTPAPVGSASDYKALIMDEAGGRNLTTNWVLRPNLQYYSYHTGALISTSDAAGELSLPLVSSLESGPGGFAAYTGINTTGATWIPKAGTTCNSWASTATSAIRGEAGISNDPTGFVDTNGSYTCDSNLRLYCVRQ
ncbi:DUF1554 domain-containing protein [Leptospira perolatii]|nr:DUF1554 domain-containing protein [Leptospira perolatii]